MADKLSPTEKRALVRHHARRIDEINIHTRRDLIENAQRIIALLKSLPKNEYPKD